MVVTLALNLTFSPGEIAGGGSDDQMKMIFHQTVGMDLPTIAGVESFESF